MTRNAFPARRIANAEAPPMPLMVADIVQVLVAEQSGAPQRAVGSAARAIGDGRGEGA